MNSHLLIVRAKGLLIGRHLGFSVSQPPMKNVQIGKTRSTSGFLRALAMSLFCASAVAQAVVSKQGSDHWVVLPAGDAQVNGHQLTWELELQRTGKYVVQVIMKDGVIPPDLSATVTVAGQTVKGTLKADYVVGKSAVAELASSITFKEEGRHTLTIETAANLGQVRIVPHFSNGLGSGTYHEAWLKMHESPTKQAALAWFKEARFGMFIHWGLYSDAAGSWKGTRIEASPNPGPKVAEWLMFAFRIPRAEYAELAKSFNPDRSFAQNIARLAKDVGMKYVVITSKHHDGFALFDSASSDYDIVDQSPYRADAVKELYDACRKEGLEFGVYYSHGNDWQDGTDGNYANIKKRNDALGIFTHPNGKNLWDPSANTHAQYLESKAYPQIAELIRLLPELRLIWFDGEGFITEEQAFRFYKLVYDLNPKVIVNRRVGYDFGDYLDAGDNVIPSADAKMTKHWETCGTTNNSWGYKAYDHDWKSTRELLYYFIDIASKGGNYLLNIGPDGKGQVPAESARHLREMGQWVRTNGDAIYGTTRWKIAHEGRGETLLEGTDSREKKGFSRTFATGDFWFTSKGNQVYAMSLVPAGETVRIRSLNPSVGAIKQVRLLGSDQKLTWLQREQALEIDFRGIATDANGFAVEITLAEPTHAQSGVGHNKPSK